MTTATAHHHHHHAHARNHPGLADPITVRPTFLGVGAQQRCWQQGHVCWMRRRGLQALPGNSSSSSSSSSCTSPLLHTTVLVNTSPWQLPHSLVLVRLFDHHPAPTLY